MRVGMLILGVMTLAGCVSSRQTPIVVAPAAAIPGAPDTALSEVEQLPEPTPAGEQPQADPNGESKTKGQPPQSPQQPQPKPSVPTPPSPWSLFTTVGNGFVSNVNFDTGNVAAYGAVLGTGIRYEGDDFEFSYEAAGHSYSMTNRWDRVSHFLAASFERDLPGNWELETAGNVAFKGSSEDRDVVDQDLEFSPQLAYLFTPLRRVRFFTVHRVKRYLDAPETNALKHYVGGEFREITRPGQYVEVGGRFETNNERLDRGDYRRWTYWVEQGIPLTNRDAVVLQLRYRLKKYTSRFVEVEDEDVLRVDHRWVPSVSWIRRFGSNMNFRVDYTYETNYSNNPEREYGAHILWTSVGLNWCSDCWPFSR